ncbi:unnamed protein product [Heligmosomoides polygyrus]|uniref:Secreted protein n=1 Tax=Heligmosomoides polygyrus TaxID=6339 RepID=A0A183F3P8_HELPZ|nr:unnamed protein product [Heligmosomoides polygyrus]
MSMYLSACLPKAAQVLSCGGVTALEFLCQLSGAAPETLPYQLQKALSSTATGVPDHETKPRSSFSNLRNRTFIVS